MSDQTKAIREEMLDRFGEVNTGNQLDAAELGYELGMVMVRHFASELESRNPEAGEVEDFVKEIDRGRALTPEELVDRVIARYRNYWEVAR